jgi:hypothetical protein
MFDYDLQAMDEAASEGRQFTVKLNVAIREMLLRPDQMVFHNK